MMKQNIIGALERAFTTIKEDNITDVTEIETVVYDEVEAEYEFEQETETWG